MSAASCIFCKIIAGEIPAQKIHEDDRYIAIRDIQPQAKQHLLVLPREHVVSMSDASAELMGGLMEAGTRVAREQGLLPSGFRAVINTGAHGGQTVFHLHLHILGGESLRGGFGA